jgi:hypothetical protein
MKKFKINCSSISRSLSTVSVSAQTKKNRRFKSTINWVGKKSNRIMKKVLNLKDGALVFKKESRWYIRSRYDIDDRY